MNTVLFTLNNQRSSGKEDIIGGKPALPPKLGVPCWSNLKPISKTDWYFGVCKLFSFPQLGNSY